MNYIALVAGLVGQSLVCEEFDATGSYASILSGGGICVESLMQQDRYYLHNKLIETVYSTTCHFVDGENGVVGVQNSRKNPGIIKDFAKFVFLGSAYPTGTDWEIEAIAPNSVVYRNKDGFWHSRINGKLDDLSLNGLKGPVSNTVFRPLFDSKDTLDSYVANDGVQTILYWRNGKTYKSAKIASNLSVAAVSSENGVIFGAQAEADKNDDKLIGKQLEYRYYYSKNDENRDMKWEPGCFKNGKFVKKWPAGVLPNAVSSAVLLGRLGGNDLYQIYEKDAVHPKFYLNQPNKAKTLESVLGLNCKFTRVMDLELGIGKVLFEGKTGSKYKLYLVSSDLFRKL